MSLSRYLEEVDLLDWPTFYGVLGGHCISGQSILRLPACWAADLDPEVHEDGEDHFSLRVLSHLCEITAEILLVRNLGG